MPGNGKYQEWITDDGLMQIKAWARDGLTNRQIADNIGIKATTLCDWQKKHQKIQDAIKEGRAPVWARVEDSFYSRCEWKCVEDVTEEVIRAPNGTETIKTTRKQHWVPPDTACMIFAMKNLRPKKWRDKPDAVDDESTGDDGLIAALKASAENVLDAGDDSSLLPDQEGS